MNGDTPKAAGMAPGSPATKRKPVPTPRNTLKKPSVIDKEDRELRKKLINGADSQGQTSGESGSPDDATPRKTGGEDSEDILAALEKIPGVGSLRSLNSVGSSQPSYTFDHRAVRREESSHSISSGLSLGLLDKGERKRSLGLGERSRTSPRILMLNGRNKEDKSLLASSQEDKSGSEETDATSVSSPVSPGKVHRGTEQRRSLKSVKILESSDSSGNDEKPAIQERPLPELPLKSSTANDDAIEIISNEEIYTALLTPEDHYQELKPNCSNLLPSTTLKTDSENLTNSKRSTKLTEGSSLPSLSSNSKNYLTMTGTIKRGKLPEKSFDIQLSVTPDHLSKLEKRVHDKYHDRCFCGLRRGPHVFLISLLTIPFMLLYSTIQAFFLGSMTWFNIFLYYNEERSCCHKLLSPFVLLVYPLWIVPVTLGLGLYGGLRVVSWYWDSLVQELRDPDSGFMAWVCTKLSLPDCAPYQVVLLSAEESPNSPQCV